MSGSQKRIYPISISTSHGKAGAQHVGWVSTPLSYVSIPRGLPPRIFLQAAPGGPHSLIDVGGVLTAYIFVSPLFCLFLVSGQNGTAWLYI